MKVLSIINLKGGCAKTTTAVSMAELLATTYKKRVLLIDNDKQGNASRLYKLYNPDSTQGTPNVLKTGRIQGDVFKREDMSIWVMPCNYYMEFSVITIRDDRKSKQHDRYRKALEEVKEDFDYCIIDNPPDLGMNVVNALVASQEVIIPLNLDNYSLDGLEMLVGQIDRIKLLNPDAKLAGCLITDYERSRTSEAAEGWIRKKSGIPVFEQRIRHSNKVKDSTFYHQTVIKHSIRSGAAQDYKKFVSEYIRRSEHV